MKQNRTTLWRLTAILMALAIVLAACQPKATPTAEATAEPTKEPTAVPTPEPTATLAPPVRTVLQDFEGDVKFEDVYQAAASKGDVAFSGAGSLKSTSDTGEWHTVGTDLLNSPVNLSNQGKLCFYVYDTTANNNGRALNTVGVKLYDAGGASTERYTDNEGVGFNVKTKTNTWVPMCLNLITFTGIDLAQIVKVEFTMYWAGEYYFDDLLALPQGEELAPINAAGEETVTVVAQDFEADDTFYADYQAEVSRDTEIFKTGASSLKAFGESGEWHAFGGFLDPKPFDATIYNKVCFWFQDTTTVNDGKADNTIGVKLFDASGANEEIWTDHEAAGENPKTVTNEWVQMCINLDAYTAVDLSQLEKVQFAMFHPGTYYVDEISFVGGGTVTEVMGQDFETEDSFYADYQAEVSLDTEIFKSGAGSLKAFGESGEWHAFGGFLDPEPFDATAYNKVCFWFRDTTTVNDGKADNTVGVKLFDASGANEEVWTDHEAAGENPKTVTNEWVQMCINLDAYTAVDLTTLQKVQFAMFHPGTYNVDAITFVGGGVKKAEKPKDEPLGLPVIVQDFEEEGSYYSDFQAEVSLDKTIFKSGTSSLKAFGESGDWHVFGGLLPKPFDASSYKQVCFSIMDTGNKDGVADNTVGVKLFDVTGANEEIWSDNTASTKDQKTVKDEWIEVCLKLDAFTAVDKTQLEKVQIAMFWASTYYLDAISFVPPAPAVHAEMTGDMTQDFETADSFYMDYQADLSLDTTVFKTGKSSLKATSESGEWHVFGGLLPKPFDASGYKYVCFWIMDTTTNNGGKADNDLGVKLFDTAGTNEEKWTSDLTAGSNSKTVKDEWVQMCLDLGAYTAVDKTKLDKVQFALYWAGTYYVDAIEFIK